MYNLARLALSRDLLPDALVSLLDNVADGQLHDNLFTAVLDLLSDLSGTTFPRSIG